MDTEREPETTAAEKPEAETPAVKQPKKKSLARRILKWFLWTVAGLLVVILLAVLTLPLWINPVGTSLANALVPKYTGTAFNLERVNLNPYTGKLLISGVKLANPEGYAEKDAFSLGMISADVEVASLLSGTIHVRDVTVDALFASWVFDAQGSNNFDRIVATVNEKLGPKKEKKEEPSETKVVVDKVTVKNVRAVVGTGVFELQSLTLSDFGKDTPAKLEISGVRLTNPPGFEAEDAFRLGSLSIGMDTGDLGKPPFVIHDFVIDSPYASYVFDEKKMDNFTRMLEPLLAKGGAAEEKPKKEKAAKKDEKKADESSGTPVTLDRLEVRNLKAQISKGRFELTSLVVTDFGKPTAALIKLEDAKLVNPEGFAEPNAFSLKALNIGIETADLSKKPTVFHDIVVDSLYAGFLVNDEWISNFTVMFKQLGGDDKEEKKTDEVAADEKKDKEKKDDEDASRVVIDRLSITGTKIQFASPIPVLKGTLPIPLPDFTDIGKKSEEGATAQEVVDQVWGAVVNKAGPAGSMIDKFVRNPFGNMKDVFSVDAAKVFGDAKDFVSSSATNLIGNAKDFVSGGATNVLGGAKEKLGNAVDSTKDLIGGLLPGGDKKDDAKGTEEKKVGDEPGLMNKATDKLKTLNPFGK